MYVMLCLGFRASMILIDLTGWHWAGCSTSPTPTYRQGPRSTHAFPSLDQTSSDSHGIFEHPVIFSHPLFLILSKRPTLAILLSLCR